MDYNIFSNLEYCGAIVDAFRQLLIYSHGFSALAALLISTTVYFKSSQLLSKILIFIALCFGLWAFFDLVIWLGYAQGSLVMFAWAPIEIFSVALFCLSFYFAFVFLYKRDLSTRGKVLLFSPLAPIIVAAASRFNLQWFDIQECIAIESPWYTNYVFAVKILFALGTAAMILRVALATKNAYEKRKILVLAAGILVFLYAFFISGYISDTTFDYTYEMYGLFGMVVFLSSLAYLIVKFKTFNIKLLATQALVWALWIMIGAILFVAQTDATRIVTAATEVLAIVFGIMLIKSVKREVMQREQLQKLTNELASKNQKLQELDVQKSQFLSFASHDLKSPVNIIKQFASLILDKTYSTPEKILETALKIKINAERAVGLVDDFLDLRRLEDGKMEYTFEKKNLVALTHDLVEDFKVVAKEQKNIDVVFTTTRNEILANLDVSRFNQVIQNLLSNSLKYTEAGSITVNLKDEQSTALLEVHDTGIGMSAELIPSLFEQFHRAPGVAKKIQGTGLGLYIAKQIVLGHGGEIWASSEGAGKGSSFFVRIRKTQ